MGDAGLELLIILVQPAEDRGRFLGPVAQKVLNFRDDILVMPLHIGWPLPRRHLRPLGEGSRAFAVQFAVQFLEACHGFLEACQGFTQVAPLGDHVAHHLLLGLDTAKCGLVQLLQRLAAAGFVQEVSLPIFYPKFSFYLLGPVGFEPTINVL